MRKLKIPFGVLINRSDIGSDEVCNYCKDEDIPILMQIPFKKEIAMAYSKGIPLVAEEAGLKEGFGKLYDDIERCRVASRIS